MNLRFDTKLNRCLIIAEAGVNHNGSSALAHRLIDVAADCGADAVKFQTFSPEGLVAKDAALAPYQRTGGRTTQLELLMSLTLPSSAWRELASHALERDIMFMSSAFDLGSLDLIVDAGAMALKVSSGELDNLPFIRNVASRHLPVIISTGIGTLSEVASAIDAASAAPSVSLLHCVTAYPAPIESSNLRAISTMANNFHVPVGWSDHTEGWVTAVGAVTLGAAILEKHITTDRELVGPDHGASADPEGFAEYVSAVRAVEAAMGDGVKRPASVELANKTAVRRSYHAKRELSPGDRIRLDDVTLLRPATGLPPNACIVGRTVRRHVPSGRPVVAEDLE